MSDEEDDVEDAAYKLMMSVARGRPLPKESRPPHATAERLRHFMPIFKHPLPMSEDWAQFQTVLNRVMSCRLNDQCRAAVTLNNAWALEEAFMAGAPADVQDVNGFAPIHIACQQNGFDCVMVLLNIGVDINVPTVSGVTPLYLAHAAGATQCFMLLSEHKAKLIADSQMKLAGATILDPASNEHRNYDDHF